MRKIKIVGLVAFLVILVGMSIWTGYRENRYISYTEMISAIEENKVSKVTLHAGEDIVEIELNGGTTKLVRVPSINSLSDYITEKSKKGSGALIFEKKEKKDAFEIVQTVISILLSIILRIAEIVLLILLIRTVIKAKKKDGEESNESSSSLKEMFNIFATSEFTKETKSEVKFSDVAGIDEEREQLEELVDFLKAPEKYQALGASIPRGVLLSGMPGTGKTLLAKAIAGEAGVPFFEVNGSYFEQKYVGVGAERVRQLFKVAKAAAPSIIFIDEIDVVAQKRYRDNNNYSEQTLNTLLGEMDGFKSSTGVIVIAATNHEEVLDEAITRPGRFDRKLFIPMPDEQARKEILTVHARNKKMESNVTISEIAKKTVGFSGAELENLLNEAAILAAKENEKYIKKAHLQEAFTRIIVGLEKKNRPISKKDRAQTAIHEAGHAIVSMVLCPDTEILGISIIPRGRAGGYNLFSNAEKHYWTREETMAQMSVAYGGRAAEEILLGIISSGPASDLQKASKIAYKMLMNYGTDQYLVTSIGDTEFDSYLLQNRFQQIEKLCNEAYEESKRIIKEHETIVKKLAFMLFEKETLSSYEIKKFIEENVKVKE